MNAARLVLSLFALASCSLGVEAAHVHFIHQSTGDNWLRDYDEWDPDFGGGNLRANLQSDGHVVTDNWHYDDNAPYCPWDPEWAGLCALFINDGARLPAEARTADIIIIKSCFYPTEYLVDDVTLQSWKDHSVSDIVGYFNAHPEQKLIYCSSVPHHRQGENCPPPAVRARGRAWGQWLEDTVAGLRSYSSHGNVVGFSAFAFTARPPGQPHENTLRAEYEISYPDNHMNRAGNVACAARVRELVNAMASGVGEGPSRRSLELSVWPNPAVGQVHLLGRGLASAGTRVCLHDIAGRCVNVVALEGRWADEVVVDLCTGDGRRLDPGVYIVDVQGGVEARVPLVVIR